jgi:hypothetical protein
VINLTQTKKAVNLLRSPSVYENTESGFTNPFSEVSVEVKGVDKAATKKINRMFIPLANGMAA